MKYIASVLFVSSIASSITAAEPEQPRIVQADEDLRVKIEVAHRLGRVHDIRELAIEGMIEELKTFKAAVRIFDISEKLVNREQPTFEGSTYPIPFFSTYTSRGVALKIFRLP